MIRLPTAKEVTILARYNRDAAVEANNPPLDVAKSIAGVQAIIDDPRIGFFLVIEESEQIISMLLITREWSDWRNADWYLIQSVYTLPDHRRKGCFTRLLAAVEKMARDDVQCCGLKLEVRKDNHRAQAVYTTLGFSDFHHKVMTKEL